MTGSRNQGLQKFMKALKAEGVKMALLENSRYQKRQKSMMIVAMIAGIKDSRGITRFKLKLMIENICLIY